MPRARGRRVRPVNPAGLVYRQRLRAREHRAVQQEVIRPRRNRNPRNIQPVQADEQANVQPEPAVPQVQYLPVPVIPPVQQVLPPVQPVSTQNQGVQAEPVVANGENLLNMPCTNDTHTPMLMAFSNELDIVLPQTLKDKIWNLEYIDLSLLLRQNFNFPNENQNCIAADNGRLVLQSVNKPAKTH